MLMGSFSRMKCCKRAKMLFYSIFLSFVILLFLGRILYKNFTRSDQKTNYFAYEELADGTLRIIGYDESQNTQNPYQVVIPAIIDGKKVSVIGAGALSLPDSNSYYLEELTISEGITALEENMAAGAANLSLISIPDSVTIIDKYAFWDKDVFRHSDLVISCNDTSYAYEYARENRFAVRIPFPTLLENAFLQEYAGASYLPYWGHFRTEGVLHDYITIEYADPKITERLNGVYTAGISYSEFRVLVLDKDTGEVLQCLDGNTFTEPAACFNVLSLADINFDGIEDLVLYTGSSGTGAAAFSLLFAYNVSTGQYEYAASLDNVSIHDDKQCIYSRSRSGAAYYIIKRYEYLDGVLTCVATLEQKGTDDYGLTVTDSRLVDGEWLVYQVETFYPQDPSAENAWQEVYEQAEMLYVNDGYWDQ